MVDVGAGEELEVGVGAWSNPSIFIAEGFDEEVEEADNYSFHNSLDIAVAAVVAEQVGEEQAFLLLEVVVSVVASARNPQVSSKDHLPNLLLRFFYHLLHLPNLLE